MSSMFPSVDSVYDTVIKMETKASAKTELMLMYLRGEIPLNVFNIVNERIQQIRNNEITIF